MSNQLPALKGGELLEYVGNDYPQYHSAQYKFHSYGYQKGLVNVCDAAGRMLLWMPARDFVLSWVEMIKPRKLPQNMPMKGKTTVLNVSAHIMNEFAVIAHRLRKPEAIAALENLSELFAQKAKELQECDRKHN